MPLVVPKPDLTPWGTHDCRLEWNSATTIRLVRYGGQYLMMGGVRQVIPAAGIVHVTPLADVNAAVYTYMSGTTMLLTVDGSYLTPNIDANGMPVHPVYPERTLVGFIYCQSIGIDGPRLVCSYWNRKARTTQGGATASTGSTTPVALHANLQCYFVCFAGDAVEVYAIGNVTNTAVANASMNTAGYIDGVSVGQNNSASPAAANYSRPVGVRTSVQIPASGLHSFTPYGWTNAGSGTWNLYSGVRWLA